LVEDLPTRPLQRALSREPLEPSIDEPVVQDEATRQLTLPMQVALGVPARRRRTSGFAWMVLGSWLLAAVVVAMVLAFPRHRALRGAVSTLPSAMAVVPQLRVLAPKDELPAGFFRVVLLEPSPVAVTARSSSTPPTPVRADDPEPEVATGDVLIVSARPGERVEVYHGERFLGTTPVRARLPAGTVALGIKMLEGGARVPLNAVVAPGRVSVITVSARH
jgi:hypothetical protein